MKIKEEKIPGVVMAVVVAIGDASDSKLHKGFFDEQGTGFLGGP